MNESLKEQIEEVLMATFPPELRWKGKYLTDKSAEAILSLLQSAVREARIDELEGLKKKDFMTATIIDEPSFSDPARLGVANDMFSAVKISVINDRIKALEETK